MSTGLPITYRDATPDDLGFILSSWLRSAGDAWGDLKRADASAFRGTEAGWFADVPHRFTRAAVVEITERPGAESIVACDPEAPHVLYGFIVAEPSQRIVHWCHVKHEFRRAGIGRELLYRVLPDIATNGATCTYLGRGFIGWKTKYALTFNPHAGRK